MSLTLAIVLGIVGIFVLTIVAIVLVARKQGPAIMEARRTFFEQTGYAVSDPPRVSLKGSEERQVRRIDAAREIHFHAVLTREPGKIVRRQSWWMPLRSRPAVLLQIADRSLGSLGKAAKEVLTGSSRTWSALYPAVPITDPELSRRFVAFGPNAADVERCLATPGLRELLLACEEVDLVVTEREIRFDDPRDKNLRAARGGTSGRIAAGTAANITATIPVHRRIHSILETVERTTAARAITGSAA